MAIVPSRSTRRALCNLLVTSCCLLAAAGLSATSLAGQSPQAEVRAVVDGLFDAMRGGDRAAAEALFHPDAVLGGPVQTDEGVGLRMSGVQGFLEAIGNAEQEWDERIWNVEIRTDSELATAWMSYAFYLDGEFSHCGVNAFQLVRSDDGWKIFVISDTRRQDDCGEIPGR